MRVAPDSRTAISAAYTEAEGDVSNDTSNLSVSETVVVSVQQEQQQQPDQLYPLLRTFAECLTVALMAASCISLGYQCSILTRPFVAGTGTYVDADGFHCTPERALGICRSATGDGSIRLFDSSKCAMAFNLLVFALAMNLTIVTALLIATAIKLCLIKQLIVRPSQRHIVVAVAWSLIAVAMNVASALAMRVCADRAREFSNQPWMGITDEFYSVWISNFILPVFVMVGGSIMSC